MAPSLRRLGEIVQAAFRILAKKPNGMPARELLAELAASMTLTPFEAEDYPKHPGTRRFEKITRFATIAPVKAGWLVKTHGDWILTEEGRRALETYPDPEQFTRAANKLYKAWRLNQPDEESDESSTSEAAVTLEEAEEQARTEIRDFLAAMNPYDLQKLVASLLRAMGYSVSWVAPPGPDKGIDIVAHADPLGAADPRIKVQVKRLDVAITVEGLRAFMALLGNSDLGIFVSIGGFTRSAADEARAQESRKITLIDSDRLIELWVEHYGKLDESGKRLLPLKAVHYLAAGE